MLCTAVSIVQRGRVYTRSCMQPLAALPIGMICISYAEPPPAEEDLNELRLATKVSHIKAICDDSAAQMRSQGKERT